MKKNLTKCIPNRVTEAKKILEKSKKKCRISNSGTGSLTRNLRRFAEGTSEEEAQIERAKQESTLACKIKAILKKTHLRRLRNILSSNNLSTIQVAADGDCFFNATILQIPTENFTVSTLRQRVCEHLIENTRTITEGD